MELFVIVGGLFWLLCLLAHFHYLSRIATAAEKTAHESLRAASWLEHLGKGGRQ